MSKTISDIKNHKYLPALFNSVKIRDGHDNFFTPLRLIMALLVMVGHAYVVALRDLSAEPNIFLHYTFSYLAVSCFFIASGFLVTKSILYRSNVRDYSAARLLRIYPGLIIHVLFLMFVIGPLSTTLPIWDYLTHIDVWKQPLLILTFFDIKTQMDGFDTIFRPFNIMGSFYIFRCV